MGETPLPKDHRNWPTDPYQLLGITRSTNLKKVKSRYVGLIKHYKPERFPDEFKKIRAAFETVKLSLEGPRSARPHSNPDAPIFGPDKTDAKLESKNEAGGSDDLVPFESMDDIGIRDVDGHGASRAKVNEAWRMAENGEPERAYQELHLLEKDCTRGDIALRIYWLLHLFPHVDRSQHRCDWLVKSIFAPNASATESEQSLRQLYLAELRTCQQESSSTRFEAILEKVESPEVLHELIVARWKIVGRWQPKVVNKDLEQLKSRMQFQNDLVWGKTVVEAIKYLAWAEPVGHHKDLEFWLRELHQLKHLDWELGDQFDSIECMLGITKVWPRIKRTPVPKNWIDFFPVSFTGTDMQVLDATEEIIRHIVKDPSVALDLVDRLKFSPQALDYFEIKLLSYPSWVQVNEYDLRSQVMLEETIREWLLYKKHLYYRRHLLKFCVNELIMPRDVSLVALKEVPHRSEWGQQIVKDLPLNLVCQVYRNYWS